MRAAMLRQLGQPLRLEQVPDPPCHDGDVVLQVECCGVCHSDLHIAEGDQPLLRPRTKLPLILGHEVVGRVVEVARDVTALRPGDRVGVPWSQWSCGACDACREGREQLCPRSAVTGLTVDGGYAQYMRAPASHAVPIPDGLGAAEASPLLCAGVTVYRALHQAGARAGQRVAVFGVGGLGHLAVQFAAALGAEVLAVDVAEDKLRLARRLGAIDTFVSDSDTVPRLQALGGVHVALVTSAAKAAYDQALPCVRPGGALAVIGLTSQPLSLPALAIIALELRIFGSAVGTRADLRGVLALAAERRIRCEVESAPLENINDVFQRLRRGDVRGRVVVEPAGAAMRRPEEEAA